MNEKTKLQHSTRRNGDETHLDILLTRHEDQDVSFHATQMNSDRLLYRSIHIVFYLERVEFNCRVTKMLCILCIYLQQIGVRTSKAANHDQIINVKVEEGLETILVKTAVA